MKPTFVGLCILGLVAACATHRATLDAPSTPLVRREVVACGGPLVRSRPEDSWSFDEVLEGDLAPRGLVDGGTLRLVKCPDGDLIDAEKIRYGHAADLRWVSHQSDAGADFDYYDATGTIVGRSSSTENGGECIEGQFPPISTRFVTDFDLCDPALHVATDAAAAAPPPRFLGFLKKTKDPWQPCIVPPARACIRSCPSYDEVLRDASDHVVACDPKGAKRVYPVMSTGQVGDYRYIAVGGGYTGIVDWFDASGRLIGERRTSDALSRHACSAETAIYGTVPDFDGELTSASEFCRREANNFPNGLFEPLWRNSSAP